MADAAGRGEVGHQRGHVVGRVGVDLLPGGVLPEDLRGHRGARPRADRVGADADPAQAAGGRERQRGDAGLRGGVVGLPGRAAQERLGGGVDDAGLHRRPGLLRAVAPVGRGVAREQEVAAQVHPDHVVPLLVGEVEQHPVAGHARVVDHDVERAEALDGGGDHRVGRGALPHVPLDDGDLAAAGLDLVDGLVGRPGEVVEHHPRPGVDQGQRLGPAEAGAGTGDDGDLAVEGESIGHGVGHRVSPPGRSRRAGRRRRPASRRRCCRRSCARS